MIRRARNENSSFRCFSTIKPGGTAYEGVDADNYILSGEEIDQAGAEDKIRTRWGYKQFRSQNW
jgi:hypothetical protein